MYGAWVDASRLRDLHFPAAFRLIFGEYQAFPLSLSRDILLTALAGALLALGAVAASSGVSAQDSDESAPAALAHSEQILGHWQRGKGEAVIEISEHDGVYSGVIVWSHKRPETVGIEVFRGLRYDPEAREWRGRAFSIKRKREVRVDIALPEHDQLELTAHILIFTKDVEFTRIPSARLAALRGKRGRGL
jgi:uncharacterized protein (DUF2147 family)